MGLHYSAVCLKRDLIRNYGFRGTAEHSPPGQRSGGQQGQKSEGPFHIIKMPPCHNSMMRYRQIGFAKTAPMPVVRFLCAQP